MIYQTIIHSFESARKTRASWRHLLLQNDVSHGVRRCNVVLRWKDVTYTCKYMRNNPTFGVISSVQWWNVGRSWRLQMYFRRLLCLKRNRSALLRCVNCWVIIHCLSISCTNINHLCCALMIWSSLQLTSKQWIITQQLTARADLFLDYSKFLKLRGGQCEPNIESWKIRNRDV